MSGESTIQIPADHVIYKGKAALQLSLKPGAPTTIKKETRDYVGTNKGCIFVVGANNIGPRKYDWENKVTIGLNEHEVAKFMRGLKGVSQTFYHDTNKGREGEGEIVKTMSISKASSGDKLFVNISMTKHGKETKINGVPIEPEEAMGLHALLSSALPRILGWS